MNRPNVWVIVHSLSNGEAGSLKHGSPFLIHSGTSSATGKVPSATTQTLKFHNHFPPDTLRYVHILHAQNLKNKVWSKLLPEQNRYMRVIFNFFLIFEKLCN